MRESSLQDTGGTGHSPRTPENLFRVLADPRRRQVVAVLDSREDNRITLDRLRQRLLASGCEIDPDELLIHLYHVDIPLLEDHGIIDYDDQSETIRYDDCELRSDVLAAIDRIETA